MLKFKQVQGLFINGCFSHPACHDQLTVYRCSVEVGLIFHAPHQPCQQPDLLIGSTRATTAYLLVRSWHLMVISQEKIYYSIFINLY